MKVVISIILFSIAIILIGQNLNKPFWGEHDWNGARYGNIARNYLRYGLVFTKLGQVENSGQVSSSKIEYYTHYPPLLPIFIAASYKAFGISEWSTRLIPLFATASSLVLIFLIGSTIWDIKRGIFAGLFALVTPMSLYFGKNPVHEPVVLFFILLSFWGYLNFKLRKRKKYKYIFLSGLILAEMTAWAGYFLIPAIAIVSILRKDKASLKELTPYWLLSLILFFGHFIHIAFLTGQVSGGNLFESFLQRSGMSKEVQPEGFNFIGYILRLKLWFATLFTIALSFLAIIWVIIKKFGINNKDWPICVLGILGFIYIALFTNSVFIHNYLIFYFLPFLSLAAADGLNFLMHSRILKTVKWFLPITFLVLIFFERKSFTEALNASSGDKLAVEVGKAINRQTNLYDKILISPAGFSDSADKFLRFYSDRYLLYLDDDNLDYDFKASIKQDLGKFEIIKRK